MAWPPKQVPWCRWLEDAASHHQSDEGYGVAMTGPYRYGLPYDRYQNKKKALPVGALKVKLVCERGNTVKGCESLGESYNLRIVSDISETFWDEAKSSCRSLWPSNHSCFKTWCRAGSWRTSRATALRTANCTCFLYLFVSFR